MLASYIEAILHKNGIHWNNGGSVGNKNDIGNGATVTYSFLNSRPDGLSKELYKNFAPFSTEQQKQIRTALAHYEDIANIRFQKRSSGGTIQLGYADTFFDFDGDGELEPAGGLATRPNDSGARVVIDRDAKNFRPGSVGYTTVLHELGHAVGGFNDVTMGRNPDNQYTDEGEQRNKGINGRTLRAWQDNDQYTVMSYNPHPDMRGVQPRTLMLYDIAALQALYGAHWSHNAGNNRYDWKRNETFVETIWDGGGIDTIDASNQTRRSIIDLRAGHFSSIGSYRSSRDAKNNLAIAYGVTIENAKGGSGNDIITGNDSRNYLWGAGGNDSLFGNGGNDFLSGGDGNDYLDGGTGSDRMFGNTGNDSYVVDSIGDRVTEFNNQGIDRVYSSVSYTLGNHVENLTLQGSAYRGFGNSLNNSLRGNNSRNYLWGAGGNDSLFGRGGNDFLSGGDGNDLLSGGGGNDYLDGGTGSDRMFGNTGNDSYVVDSTGDRVTEFNNQGIDRVYSSVSYTLGNHVENLTLQGSAYRGFGNSLNNSLRGNNSRNYLWGAGGNDSLYGRGGNDILSGGDGNDLLSGGGGNDYLDGGTGSDHMFGNTGNDSYVVDSIGDRVTEYNNQGTDVVYSSVNYTLGNHLEYLELQGSAYRGFGNSLNNSIVGNDSANHLWGGQGNDSLFGRGGNDLLRGGSDNDYLDGGTGNDRMFGQTGNDSYVVDSTGDRVTEFNNQGIDVVYSSVNYTLGNHLEYLELRGSAYRGFGNNLNNSIVGNDSRNYLWGAGGNDSLFGNGGNDILSGGDGNDYLDGGTGSDRMFGHSGHDTLTGGSGDDLLYGGANNDTLIGGADADKFAFNNLNEGIDHIVDFVKAESDKLQIRANGFGGGLRAGFLDAAQFVLGSAATNANERFIYNQSTGALAFDIDGSGTQAAVQFATLSSGLNLTSSDFILV
ncbi:MAG: hypothetical protein F6K14_29650 [Symploca sp. SIO2C1]|nr:hypothetical protein [Symploca sp. SIO2C1]